jgi:hypothetical protein
MNPAPGYFSLPSLDLWTTRDRETLFALVDDSDYSLTDWIEALGAFDAWLEERGESSRPWREIVGYVHCCTLMASPGVGLVDLKVIVFKALTEFGFEFIGESQS